MKTTLRTLARRAAMVVEEVLRAARSQPVASALTIVMVGGMCAAVLLTTGRTVGAERAALARIDAAGTRSVIVRADASAGITVAILDQLTAVDGIESASGFGPIVDAHNAVVPSAPLVAVRPAYGVIGDRPLLATEPTGVEERALASPTAMQALGLWEGTGALVTADGQGIVVSGGLTVPEHLAFLEPLVVIPSSTTDSAAGRDAEAPLTVLVVLARTPHEVAAVEATIKSLLNPTDPTKMKVETSADLAAIRAAVSGELGSYGRGLILAILAVAALLVAVNLLALVTMRRKDFGRRRALGASQSLIMVLLLGQVLVQSVIGAIAGVTAALVVLVASRSPVPGSSFVAAVATAAIVTALLAAIPPAFIASRRDPLHELRVP